MQKLNFENSPSTNTPINATNLNLVQTNVENEFGNYLRPYILFDYPNGSVDNSNTLNDYIQNYDYVEVFYKTNDNNENSGKFVTKNRSNISICLNCNTISDTYIWLQNALYTLNSDKITRNKEKVIRISASAIDYSENTTNIFRITKVVGYK